MPLGEGYSVEEQLTGEAEWGGLQIVVAPLKASVWQKKLDEWDRCQEVRPLYLRRQNVAYSMSTPPPMALAAGGKMRQEIFPDPYSLEDWDFSAAERVFVTLVHAKDWLGITGEAALDMPPSASEYTKAGLPWFEYYGKDQEGLPGGKPLTQVKSVSSIFKQTTGANLPGSEDISVNTIMSVGPRAKEPRAIILGKPWD